MAGTAHPVRRSPWRTARRVFRWSRMVVWVFVLALLLAGIWLNQVGLPDFVKEKLVAELRAHGLDLEFTRMRLAFHRGIVADDITFGARAERGTVHGSAAQAEVRPRWRPLLTGRVDIKSVGLRDGRVTFPVWGTNDTPREVTVENVGGELLLLTGDRWELNGLQAESFGVKFRLNGTITNASHVLAARALPKRPEARTPQAFWHDLVRQFERTQFAQPTEVVANISGDARDVGSLRAYLDITSPHIDSPWGQGKQVKLAAHIVPETGQLIHAKVKLQASEADTHWGRADTVQMDLEVTPSLTQWTPTNAHLLLNVRRALTPWGRAAALHIKADFRPNPSDQASSLAEYAVRGQQIQTEWAQFAQAEMTASGVVSSSNAWPRTARTTLKFAGGQIDAGRAASGAVEASLTLPPLDEMQFADTNVTWWTRLDRVAAEASAQFANVRTDKIAVPELTLAAHWSAPELTVREAAARLDSGTFRGAASLNSHTRSLTANANTDFNPHRIEALLTKSARRWLSQFTWEEPPRVTAAVQVTLPPWTNSVVWQETDWREQVAPTLVLNGHVDSGPASFRGVPASAASTDFAYSNRTWRLPNLVITRPEGKAHVAHISNERTHEYSFVIDSLIDPRVLRPALDPSAQRVLDDFVFSGPPDVRAEISGQWREPKDTSLRATFTATNLMFKSNGVIEARSLITLTNQVLSFVAPQVVRGEGVAGAESVVIDIPAEKLFINHATGTLAAEAVTHSINDSVRRTMEPYRFIEAPSGHVHGHVDLDDELRSDLMFTLAGGPFEWRAFRFQQITGQVHWAGRYLTISNLVGTLHGGRMEASMHMDFTAKEGADFAFRTLVHDINLQSLVKDLSTNENTKIEGTLAGLLVVTNANTEDLNSWFGYGNMTVHEGLIWDVPVFGIFSPMLNAIKPGAGNNRAREAVATFVITNSVIATADLRIHASGMRLQYDGTVDFETRVNGKMQAELFRDTPGVGGFVSKVFWPVTKLFEYKVTGTFGKPKSEPLYIPKIFMMPFHPVRTLKELLGDGEK